MIVRFRTLARSFKDFDPETRVTKRIFQPAGFVDLDVTPEAYADLTRPGSFTATRTDGPKAGRIILDLTHPPLVREP